MNMHIYIYMLGIWKVWIELCKTRVIAMEAYKIKLSFFILQQTCGNIRTNLKK